MMKEHEKWMKRCFEIARNGQGRVAPNPMVGAVLVHGNRIIGEGWHREYGKEHAEVNCVNNVTEKDKRLISEATMYVSLEPCAHFGKTPPCAHFIFQHRIPRVVVSCEDPFHKVNGSGIDYMRKNGVEVIVGVLEDEGRESNKVFFTFHLHQRPYITLKWAQTADGFMGSGTPKRLMISGKAAQTLTHRMRSEHAAILIGTRTALWDNPSLTTRLWPGKSPVRIVIDLRLSLPDSSQLFTDGHPTIIINHERSAEEGVVTWHQIGRDENPATAVMEWMHRHMLTSLLVEGGAETLQSFIRQNLWDEAVVLESKTVLAGSGLKAPMLHQPAQQKMQLPDTTVYIFANRK